MSITCDLRLTFTYPWMEYLSRHADKEYQGSGVYDFVGATFVSLPPIGAQIRIHPKVDVVVTGYYFGAGDDDPKSFTYVSIDVQPSDSPSDIEDDPDFPNGVNDYIRYLLEQQQWTEQ